LFVHLVIGRNDSLAEYPTVKTRIEELIQSGDCSGLQAEFDIADQNDAAQRNRVGVGNADLMNYINTSMQKLGCL
jgi:hypothetical protein